MPLISEEIQQSWFGKVILVTLSVAIQVALVWLVLVTLPKRKGRRNR